MTNACSTAVQTQTQLSVPCRHIQQIINCNLSATWLNHPLWSTYEGLALAGMVQSENDLQLSQILALVTPSSWFLCAGRDTDTNHYPFPPFSTWLEKSWQPSQTWKFSLTVSFMAKVFAKPGRLTHRPIILSAEVNPYEKLVWLLPFHNELCCIMSLSINASLNAISEFPERKTQTLEQVSCQDQSSHMLFHPHPHRDGMQPDKSKPWVTPVAKTNTTLNNSLAL